MAASLTLKSKLPGVLRYLGDTSRNARYISTSSVYLARPKLNEKNQNAGEDGTDGRTKQNIKNVPSIKSNGIKKNIFIPQKIERSPTAILEALSSTIKVVPSSPIYMEIDDPCTHESMTDTNMVAKHNGRKAARLMISTYPDYFSQMWDESINEGFNDDDPSKFKKSKPSEEALLERIKKKAVKEADKMYEECKRNSVALSQEIRESLLELLCVYNCDDPSLTAGTESYLTLNRDIFDWRHDVADTWRQGNQAETLFKELPEKTEKAYNVLLRGMASHHHSNAFAIYSEMKSNNIPVDVESFNCLLKIVHVHTDNYDETMKTIKELLSDMSQMDVTPNTTTFDSAIIPLTHGFTTIDSIKFVFSLLAEMKACNCELQLSTYAPLMRLLFTTRLNNRSGITLNKEQMMEEILNSMEGREFTVSTPLDVSFFSLAASVINRDLSDSKLMLKLHGILSHSRNINALGHRSLTQTYYHDVLQLLIQLEHTDTVMEVYKQLNFPSFKIDSSRHGNSTSADLLNNIDMHNTHHYLPQLFNDFFHKGMTFGNHSQLPAMLKMMAKKKFDPELQQQFSSVASFILDHWRKRKDLDRKSPRWHFRLDGHQIGLMMTIYMNNEEMDKAVNAFHLLDDKTLESDGDPARGGSLARMAEYFISIRDFKNTYNALEYLIEYHQDNKEVDDLIKKAESSLQMTERQSESFKALTNRKRWT